MWKEAVVGYENHRNQFTIASDPRFNLGDFWNTK
jgi:hypothetical protein